MSLTPTDFKKFAERLKKTKVYIPSNLSSARKRTIVNRYYYYLFLEIREILWSKLSPNCIEIAERKEVQRAVHKIVQDMLFHLGFPKAQSYLAQLRDARNACDYELYSNENKIYEEVEEIIDRIEIIIPVLKNIPGKNVIACFNRVLKSLNLPTC